MKILVFGCGVIGSYLVHQACAAGNDVTVAARGRTAKMLNRCGLRIKHKLQRSRTIDRPRVIAPSRAGDDAYDVVFSVMQGQQQRALISTLSTLNTSLLVLVGNDPDAAYIEREIQEERARQAGDRLPKLAILFGFQATAGVREQTHTICVRVGRSGLTVGGLHREPSARELHMLRACFSGTGYRVTACDDMDGWLWSHAAFILPIVYVSYA